MEGINYEDWFKALGFKVHKHPQTTQALVVAFSDTRIYTFSWFNIHPELRISSINTYMSIWPKSLEELSATIGMLNILKSTNENI